MIVDFVERKRPDYRRIETLLAESDRQNRWANRGPLYVECARRFAAHCNLADDVRLVPVANGGIALEAMARLLALRAGRPLRWVASAYSFRNIGRGYFHDTHLVDCNSEGLLDLDACAALDAGSYDGLIVTNPFGLFRDFSDYANFARRSGKSMLIDNASGLHERLPDWPWQAFSLHQTKPYGTGEGGLALVPSEEAEALYELLDYASELSGSPHWFGNGKISDISCAFHIDRLERIGDWAPRYAEQRTRLTALAARSGFIPLAEPQPGIPMTSLPLLAPARVERDAIFGTRHVTLAKYYKPLADLPVLRSIYDRLVNLPCHPDMATLSDTQIAEDLERLVTPARIGSVA